MEKVSGDIKKSDDERNQSTGSFRDEEKVRKLHGWRKSNEEKKASEPKEENEIGRQDRKSAGHGMRYPWWKVLQKRMNKDGC